MVNKVEELEEFDDDDRELEEEIDDLELDEAW